MAAGGAAIGLTAAILAACSVLPATPDPGPATTETVTETSSGPPPPTVREVVGAPAAAAAVQRFVDDLVAGRESTQRCWAVAPVRVRQMYADPDAVVSALTDAGVAAPTEVTWSDGSTRATVTYPQIASGYACPYVGASDDPNVLYTAADAIHVVTRYLGRLAGRPVDPADVESSQPLVCETGPSPTPLRDNPSPFDSVGLVDPTGAAALPSFGDDVRVTIPAEIDGLWRDVTALVRIGGNGYCLEELATAGSAAATPAP